MAQTRRSVADTPVAIGTRALPGQRGRRASIALVATAMAVAAVAGVALMQGPEGATADRTVGIAVPADGGAGLAATDRNPALARAVTAAAELSELRSPDARRTAVAWLEGLSEGLILPTDVEAHLAPSDPAAADAVTAMWARIIGAQGPAST